MKKWVEDLTDDAHFWTFLPDRLPVSSTTLREMHRSLVGLSLLVLVMGACFSTGTAGNVRFLTIAPKPPLGLPSFSPGLASTSHIRFLTLPIEHVCSRFQKPVAMKPREAPLTIPYRRLSTRPVECTCAPAILFLPPLTRPYTRWTLSERITRTLKVLMGAKRKKKKFFPHSETLNATLEFKIGENA